MSEATVNPSVESILIEDGVDSDLDIRVKVLNHQLTADPEDRLLHLSYAAEPARGFNVDVGMLRRVLAAVNISPEVGVTASDLPAAALRGMTDTGFLYVVPIENRHALAEAAVREVMAEVTRVLVENYPDGDRPTSEVDIGARLGIRVVATALGVDLDAELAKEGL